MWFVCLSIELIREFILTLLYNNKMKKKTFKRVRYAYSYTIYRSSIFSEIYKNVDVHDKRNDDS